MATKQKTKLAKSSLPAGYRQISATAENHDFDAEPVLEGVIRRIDTAKVPDLNTKQLVDKKVMHIEKADGERVAVWESGGLRALFECSIGAKVYIHFTGFGEPKTKGHNPPRLYEIGVSEEPPM